MNRLIPMLLVTLVAVCSAGLVWAEDPVWIDVRTAEEYSSGHVAEASNIPHDQISQKITPRSPRRCQSRSRRRAP